MEGAPAGICLWSINKFGEGFDICVDNQEILDPATEKAIDVDLSLFDTDDGAGASVNYLVFFSTAVAEDHNDFVFALGPD